MHKYTTDAIECGVGATALNNARVVKPGVQQIRVSWRSEVGNSPCIYNGRLAQSEERLAYIEEVGGAIPSSLTRAISSEERLVYIEEAGSVILSSPTRPVSSTVERLFHIQKVRGATPLLVTRTDN